MNRQEIGAVLRDVNFPGYMFQVLEAGGRCYMQGVFEASCSEDNIARLQYTRKWYLSHEATRSEIVQTALKLVLTAVEHEARERFTYRGRPIFGPHFDVDRLVTMFGEGDPLARRA